MKSYNNPENTWRRVGGAGQTMAEGYKNNWTLKCHMTWRLPAHVNPYLTLPCVRKTYSTSFFPQSSKNPTYYMVCYLDIILCPRPPGCRPLCIFFVFLHSYVNFFPATPVFLFGLAFIHVSSCVIVQHRYHKVAQ